MPKFLGSLRVIVEAEDWNEAFEYFDELLKPSNQPILSSMDVTITSVSIDKLIQTRRAYVTDRPTAPQVRRLVRREVAK